MKTKHQKLFHFYLRMTVKKPVTTPLIMLAGMALLIGLVTLIRVDTFTTYKAAIAPSRTSIAITVHIEEAHKINRNSRVYLYSTKSEGTFKAEIMEVLTKDQTVVFLIQPKHTILFDKQVPSLIYADIQTGTSTILHRLIKKGAL